MIFILMFIYLTKFRFSSISDQKPPELFALKLQETGGILDLKVERPKRTVLGTI